MRYHSRLKLCLEAHMDYSEVNWRDVFRYKVNGKLYWRRGAGNHVMRGQQAGKYVDKDGYHVVMYRKQQYRVHKIIWWMLRGPITKGMEIDHLTGSVTTIVFRTCGWWIKAGKPGTPKGA